MPASQPATFNLQEFSDVGQLLVGGRLYTYGYGTTAHKTAYTDPDGTVPQTYTPDGLGGQYIALNARGELPAPLYLGAGSYDISLKRADGSTVWTRKADGVDNAAKAVGDKFATSVGASLVGFLSSVDGAVPETAADVLQEVRSVRRFGVKGDGSDETVKLLKAKAWAIANLPAKLIFPNGTYGFTDLGNMAYKGLTLEGETDRGVVLKCLSTVNGHNALTFDAFASGSVNDPFVQRCNLRNITVQGNAKTANIIYAHGLARCAWANVFAREAEPTAGLAFHFRGVMLSRFDNLVCSTDLDAMASRPYEGLRLDEGRRAGVSVGNSSNNVFTSAYLEGLGIGVRVLRGDQNLFVGGSPESCSVYGLLIGVSSRYNMWLGTGFENPNATADIAESGMSSIFLNIYSSKSVLLQGRSAIVSGGLFERIEVQAGAQKNCVENVTINHWTTGAGGFFYADNTATEWRNIYDEDAGKFIYPMKDRTGIAVVGNPFTWLNSTGQYVEVVVQAGTLTQVRQFRGTDSWLKPLVVPATYLLPPGDALEFSYSVDPQISYVPHNGFQG